MLIGEDEIYHTPRDETVRLKLANTLDIVAERAQTNYRFIGHQLSESDYQVRIRNHKNEPITVIVQEHAWSDWEIRSSSHAHRRIDSRMVQFDVPVPARSETVLTFTVRVRW